MSSPTVLTLSVPYTQSQQDVETVRDLVRITDPLQSILKRFGHEGVRLRQRLETLQRQNVELQEGNRFLEQQRDQAREQLRSQAGATAPSPGPGAAGAAPAPAPVPVEASSIEPAGYPQDKGASGQSPGAGWLASAQTSAPTTKVVDDEHERVEVSESVDFKLFDADRPTINIHEMPVHSVTMVPNAGSDSIVASASWDATVKFYDLNTNKVVKSFSDYNEFGGGKMAGIYAVAFAKTVPNLFGCTSCDKSVYLWNSETGKLAAKLSGHTDEVNGIDFHPTQQVMCTASDDCSCIIWDIVESKELRKLNGHQKAVYGSTFFDSKNQYLCATCCFDWKARVWDLRDKALVAMVSAGTDDVIGIDYSGSQSLLATGCDDGVIMLWDSRTWKMQSEINTRTQITADNEVKRVSWSPCGKYLAAACSSGQVLVYKCDQGGGKAPPLVATLGGHTDCVFDVAWGTSPDTNKKIIVSASHDKTSRCWKEA